jgi:hypothetical protein
MQDQMKSAFIHTLQRRINTSKKTRCSDPTPKQIGRALAAPSQTTFIEEATKRAVLHRLQTHSCLLHARIDRHPSRGGLLPNQLSLLHVSLRLKRRAAVTFVQSMLFSSLNLCAHVRSGSVRDTTHARRGGVIARSGNRKWPHVDWRFVCARDADSLRMSFRGYGLGEGLLRGI